MLGFLGYNFAYDTNAYDVVPTNLNTITTVKIENGIFDHYNLTRDVIAPYSSDIPENWDFFTVMDADFKNNINAGNVDILIEQVTSIKLKRRRTKDFNWITLFDIPINKPDDLRFSINDFYNANNTEYEYALVPVIQGTEGVYITNKVFSTFRDIFVCDKDNIYKFYSNAGITDIQQVNLTGEFLPLGRKYPTIVSNGATKYQSGGFSARVLNPDYIQTRLIDKTTIADYQVLLLEFFSNKKTKVIKDWGGRIIVVGIKDNIGLSFNNGSNQFLGDISFQWSQLGDINSQEDLYETGLVEVI